MKVAVIAEDRHGFIKPMSLGLNRMLHSLGVQTHYFDRGLAMLDHHFAYSLKIEGRNWLKRAINKIKPRSFELQQTVSSKEVAAFEQQLEDFDLIIVVCPLPKSFIADQLPGIERLRLKTNVPIVLYQNYYLATRGDWPAKIKDPKNYGGGFGLERFDWYLGASVVSEYPLSQKQHPFSLIGHDLRADNLGLEDKAEFRVLLDFPQKGFESYRQRQIDALNACDIPYTELKGRYSQDEIRSLYRSHCALFLSFRESFGLPIVENQLCGNLIFTPFARWAPSHFINKSVYDPGEAALGSNFVVYDNDLEQLKSQLIKARARFSPERNLAQFKKDYPHLYSGDLEALKKLLVDVESGRIDGSSHLQYVDLI